MFRLFKSLLVASLLAASLPAEFAVAASHALVIGNSNYQKNPLQNTRHDALDMAAMLGDLGYEIFGGGAQLDLDQAAFDHALREFVDTLDNGDKALFYFAGHCANDGQHSYMIPIASAINHDAFLKYRSVQLELVVELLEAENPDGLNVVVVDACNDLPFGRGYRSSSARGLMRPAHLPAGSFVGLAASEGQVAADEGTNGRNGLYTVALLAELRRNPERRQRPIHWSDLVDDWCIGPCEEDADVSRLTVKTEPAEARVWIMNIGPVYEAGMALERGKRYDIYVTAEGYVAQRAWQTLSEPEEVIGVVLQRERAPAPQPEPATRAWFEPETVEIPGGRFQMGCLTDDGECRDHRKPVRSVSVPSFRLGRYEVTRGQFAAFVDWSGYETEAERNVGGDGCVFWNGNEWAWGEEHSWRNPGFEQTDDHPVVCVSWNDVQAYIGWLNERTGKRYRLPSEAEWECAARGGTRSKYYFGDDPSDLCTYGNVADQTLQQTSGVTGTADCSDGAVHTAEVGSYKPTWRGVHDLHGNVWEWLEDRFHESYAGAPTYGAWNNEPQRLRSADRAGNVAASRDINVGIRLAENRAR